MKHPYPKHFMKKSLLIVALIACGLKGFAQDDIDNIIQGSVKDAEYLMKGYTAPLLKAFGTTLNQGWYNTGAAHKVAGFDLTFTTSLAYFKSEDLTYYVDNSKMTNLQLVDASNTPTNGYVPTAVGAATPTPRYRVVQNGVTSYVNGPVGVLSDVGLKVLPSPMVQVGFGLPKGTDLKVRFIPEFNIGDKIKFNTFGLGVMHDIKQWIPGIKNLPFDLSGFVGYTKLKLDVGLDDADATKRGILESNAWSVQAIASKKLSVLTVYASVGYNAAKTGLAMKGTYTFTNGNIKDPISINETANGFRATGGLRLKLAVITFHADYTLQKYNTLTAGFGINIR